MPLTPITENNYKLAAQVLHTYWRNRGLPHSYQWALDYLQQGHGKDIISDQFFLYRENNTSAGLVALVVQEGSVGEIRDEVIFVQGTQSPDSFKDMIATVVDYAKRSGLRKVYSFVLEEHLADYESLHFEKEGQLKSHFKDGEDLTIMSMFLHQH